MKRLLVILVVCAVPLWAVEPSELLDDPALEARARALSAELRCLVCQNESIDESDADIARDLRLLVRERLLAGDTDQEVLDFVVARYGEFVLLQPQFGGSNLLLWLTGPLAFGCAAFGAWRYGRTRSKATEAPQTLTTAEKKRLDELIGK